MSLNMNAPSTRLEFYLCAYGQYVHYLAEEHAADKQGREGNGHHSGSDIDVDRSLRLGE